MQPESSSPVVLVTDAGKACSIAVIRSLSRAGYEVVAADAVAASLGFQSRHVARHEVYPSPRRHHERFCDAVLDIVRRHRIDLVIPATDWTVRPLASERSAFEGITRLAIAETSALEVTNRKEATVALAERVGVPVPETRLVRTVGEAVDAAPRLGWPLVLKPQSSHRFDDGAGMEKLRVTYAASEAELRQKMAGFEGHCAVLLQRLLRGEGGGVSMLLSRGRPIAAFEHRRLREIPITGGASSYRESVELDPVRYGHAERMLRELSWTGLAMVEFKTGDGRSELMEINGRVWGSLPLAVASGVDFPAMLARLYLEGEQALDDVRIGDYRVGVRCRHLDSDLLWIAQTLARRHHHPFMPAPPRSAGLAAALGMLDPRNKMDVQCLEDPLPGLVELPRLVRKLWRKAREARSKPSDPLSTSGSVSVGSLSN